MRRYLQAFFRHPILLSAPIIIALVVGIGYEAKQPRKWVAWATVWCDSPVPNDSTVFSTTSQPPSGGQAAVFTELLQTHAFQASVGAHSPWASYLASHSQADDDRVLGRIVGSISVSTPGPHVLAISASGATPEQAAQLATAVTTQYISGVVGTEQTRAQALVGYYQQEVDATQKELAAAQAKLNDWLRANPVGAAGSVSDLTGTQLAAAVAVAQQRYDDAAANRTRAGLSLTTAPEAGGLRVIDQPTVPQFPKSRKKQLIFGGVGALLAGGMISLLALLFLVASDKTVRDVADIEEELGLNVVGTIGQFRTRRGDELERPSRQPRKALARSRAVSSPIMGTQQDVFHENRSQSEHGAEPATGQAGPRPKSVFQQFP
ncbi:MAG TPA: hypothetical protein VKL22_07680 [Actinomycetota bacterium]|nr:hypothetical protein [Actinomycetota bacterium]